MVPEKWGGASVSVQGRSERAVVGGYGCGFPGPILETGLPMLCGVSECIISGRVWLQGSITPGNGRMN